MVELVGYMGSLDQRDALRGLSLHVDELLIVQQLKISDFELRLYDNFGGVDNCLLKIYDISPDYPS